MQSASANNHYNETITALVGKQGLHGKVERFARLSAKANKSMTALEPIHDDVDSDRLESVNSSTENDPDLAPLDEGAAVSIETDPQTAKTGV